MSTAFSNLGKLLGCARAAVSTVQLNCCCDALLNADSNALVGIAAYSHIAAVICWFVVSAADARAAHVHRL
jgi:hypothetical protein